MLSKYSALRAAGAAILAAALLLACERRAGIPPAAPGQPGAAPKAAAKTGAGATPGTGLADPAKPRPLLAASLRAFGFAAPARTLMPEDSVIGPLQDRRAADGSSRAILAVAARFAEGLAAGRVESSALYPDGREALSRLLAPLASPGSGAGSGASAGRGPKLGVPALTGDSAGIAVRLPAAAGSGAILLSLRSGGGDWFVESAAPFEPRSVASARGGFSPGAAESPP